MNGLALCAGIGGLELGIKLAYPDYRTVCYVERDEFCQRILRARMQDRYLDDAPVWSDVTNFDAAEWRGKIDLISAGFPCQPWSVAGRRQGTKDERWIWPDIARIIRLVGPSFVFLENVPGILYGGLGHVLSDLAESGFAAEWDCFSASEAGASQERERFFLLAYSDQISRRTWQPESQIPEWQAKFGGNGLALFPPDRSDVTVWRQVVTERPHLAPATKSRVRYVAPGTANRVDQLGALGNSVVPVVAAMAFRALWDRLIDGH